MVNLISEPYSTLYFANKCSGAFIFCVFTYLIIILMPFLIGFTTRDFWILSNHYWQQPIITTNNEYIVKLLFNDGQTQQFTNVPEILSNFSNPISGISFSQYPLSTNGQLMQQPKANNYTTNIRVTLPSTIFVANIREVQIMTFYQYELDEIVSMKMQAFSFCILKSPHGIQSAQVVGQLQFQQKHPLEAGGTQRTRFNYSSYYNSLGALLPDPGLIVENSNIERNETIYYNYLSKIDSPIQDSSLLTIQLISQVPRYQKILYQTSILESLKYSWMQYFSIFLIFWVAGQFLLEYVVKNQVFYTFKMKNIPGPLPSYTKLKKD